MKKLVSLIAGFMVIFALVSCGSDVASAETEPEYDRFVRVYTESRTFIYVDIETGVQYMLYNNGYAAAMEVLVDADGKPLLYELEELHD